MVCDRFMPSSLVFDQQDEVERRYVWSLYECLPSPDIAFILQGPPEQCAERAAARGTYSRFHDTSEEHSRQECGMFQDAAHFLKLVGYPVYEHEIGANSAEAVTNDLLNVIAERNEGRA